MVKSIVELYQSCIWKIQNKEYIKKNSYPYLQLYPVLSIPYTLYTLSILHHKLFSFLCSVITGRAILCGPVLIRCPK